MSSNEPAESTPLSRLLVILGRAFDRAGIAYMFFGGQAVLVYGEPRFTQDVDVTVGVDPYSSAVVLEALADVGLVTLVEDVAEFLRQTFVLPVRDPTRVSESILFSPNQGTNMRRLRARIRYLSNRIL